MASNTPNLDLLKKDPVADGNDTFNIETMLNENWDKIDAAVGQLEEDMQEIDIPLSDATNGTRSNVAGSEKAVGLVMLAANAANLAAGAAQTKADQAFQLGNERKAEVVAALVALGVSASTSDSWATLISKLTAIIKATGNATAADVLAGKTFSNASGNNKTGSIPKLTPVHGDQANATSISIGAYSNDGQEYAYLGVPSGYYLDGVNWIRTLKKPLTSRLIPKPIDIGVRTIPGEDIERYSYSIMGRDVNKGLLLFQVDNTQASLVRFRSKSTFQYVYTINSETNPGQGAINYLRLMFHMENDTVFWTMSGYVIQRHQLAQQQVVGWNTNLLSYFTIQKPSNNGLSPSHEEVSFHDNEINVCIKSHLDNTTTLYFYRYNTVGTLLGLSSVQLYNRRSMGSVLALPEGKFLYWYSQGNYNIATYEILDRYGNILEDFTHTTGLEFMAIALIYRRAYLKATNNDKIMYSANNSTYLQHGAYEQSLI